VRLLCKVLNIRIILIFIILFSFQKGFARMITTKKGFRYVLVENHDLPYVKLQAIFLAGSYLDPKGMEGTAGLTARSLLRGTDKHNFKDLTEQFDLLGSDISSGAGGLYSYVSGGVLSRNIDEFFSLMSEVILGPTFPKGPLEKEKGLMEGDILHRQDSDRALVQYFFHRFLYRGTTIGRPASGTIESLKKLDTKDCAAFHKKYYTKKNMVFVAAGDITQKKLEALLDKYMGALPDGEETLFQAKDLPKPRGLRVLIVDKPNRSQTQIRFGTITPGWSHGDVIPMYVANTAFGGTFTSILTTEIRIKRGWSYGVGSVFDLFRERGSVGIGMFPKVEDTVPAIKLSIKLLKKAIHEGLPPKRIESAKEFMANRFPFELETAFRRASFQASVFLRGKPADLQDTYISRVKAVTPKQADKAFSEFVDPDNMVIVVVGPAKDLEKPLKAMDGVTEVLKVPYNGDLK